MVVRNHRDCLVVSTQLVALYRYARSLWTPKMTKGGTGRRWVISVLQPKDVLLDGAKILESILLPEGFKFHFRGEGRGSGGNFAWGEFVREDRRLELHFRHTLGPVRYHVGDQSASHEPYMRELGVWDQCRYPGFSERATDSFHDLAHDVDLAKDFLSGSATTLRKAATKEARDTAVRHEDLMVGYSGDLQTREQCAPDSGKNATAMLWHLQRS